jgi:glutamate-1-semialdehyde 2,1-aminomutase
LNPITERAKAVIPGGVNSIMRRPKELGLLEIILTRGGRFWDGTGREFIDFHASFGPSFLGHAMPEVDSAFHRTVRDLSLPGLGVTRPEVELAEKLAELIPSVERSVLTSSGSEATFHALRLARAATGRRRIIKFQGCYHGWHDSIAMNVISHPDRVGAPDPLSDGILPEVLEATIVVPFNDVAAVKAAVQRHRGEIAAIIVEPIPHNIGTVMPGVGFLEALRQIATADGIVLIFDEVITGIRHDLGGFQKLAGVTPDLTTLGKALANGYPIGAIGGRADLMEVFNAGTPPSAFFGGTFNGHPGVAAAALTTLRIIERDGVHEKVFALGERARHGLRELVAGLGLDAVVCGFGSVWVTYFQSEEPHCYEDLLEQDAALFVGTRLALLEHKIFENPVNLKRSQACFAHTEADIDRLLAATEVAIPEALKRLGRVTAGSDV